MGGRQHSTGRVKQDPAALLHAPPDPEPDADPLPAGQPEGLRAPVARRVSVPGLRAAGAPPKAIAWDRLAPKGWVTLVFVTVAGGDKLEALNPGAYAAEVGAYLDEARQLLAEHEGYEVMVRGAALYAAFHGAHHALNFANLLHLRVHLRAPPSSADALYQHPSAEAVKGDGPAGYLIRGLRLAVGINSGKPRYAFLDDAAPDGTPSQQIMYTGPPARVAALLASAADGGQTLVGQATYQDLAPWLVDQTQPGCPLRHEVRAEVLGWETVRDPGGGLSLSIQAFAAMPAPLADRSTLFRREKLEHRLQTPMLDAFARIMLSRRRGSVVAKGSGDLISTLREQVADLEQDVHDLRDAKKRDAAEIDRLAAEGAAAADGLAFHKARAEELAGQCHKLTVLNDKLERDVAAQAARLSDMASELRQWVPLGEEMPGASDDPCVVVLKALPAGTAGIYESQLQALFPEAEAVKVEWTDGRPHEPGVGVVAHCVFQSEAAAEQAARDAAVTAIFGAAPASVHLGVQTLDSEDEDGGSSSSPPSRHKSRGDAAAPPGSPPASLSARAAGPKPLDSSMALLRHRSGSPSKKNGSRCGDAAQEAKGAPQKAKGRDRNLWLGVGGGAPPSGGAGSQWEVVPDGGGLADSWEFPAPVNSPEQPGLEGWNAFLSDVVAHAAAVLKDTRDGEPPPGPRRGAPRAARSPATPQQRLRPVGSFCMPEVVKGKSWQVMPEAAASRRPSAARGAQLLPADVGATARRPSARGSPPHGGVDALQMSVPVMEAPSLPVSPDRAPDGTSPGAAAAPGEVPSPSSDPEEFAKFIDAAMRQLEGFEAARGGSPLAALPRPMSHSSGHPPPHTPLHDPPQSPLAASAQSGPTAAVRQLLTQMKAFGDGLREKGAGPPASPSRAEESSRALSTACASHLGGGRTQRALSIHRSISRQSAARAADEDAFDLGALDPDESHKPSEYARRAAKASKLMLLASAFISLRLKQHRSLQRRKQTEVVGGWRVSCQRVEGNLKDLYRDDRTPHALRSTAATQAAPPVCDASAQTEAAKPLAFPKAGAARPAAPRRPAGHVRRGPALAPKSWSLALYPTAPQAARPARGSREAAPFEQLRAAQLRSHARHLAAAAAAEEDEGGTGDRLPMIV